MLERLHRDEDGIALVVSMLVLSVVLVLSTVIIAQSISTSGTSAYNRKRVQSVSASEAGINHFYSYLQTTGSEELACDPQTQDLGTAPGTASFDVTPTFYDATGAVMAPSGQGGNCGFTDETYPAGVLVRSLGTTEGDARRSMETYIQLTPILGGFDGAIITNGSLNLQNRLTLNGNQSTDADIYVASGNAVISNNPNIYGSLYVYDGTATLSNGSAVRGDVWAWGSVAVNQPGTVYQNATSSTGSISVAGTIYGNATAGTTITTSGAGQIQGTRSPNTLSPRPPQQAFPTIEWVQQDWVNAGYTVYSFSSCSSARTWITTASNVNTSSKKVVRITSPTYCDLNFSNNTSVTFGGDLAIVTDWSISMTNNVRWTGTPGSSHSLFFISHYRPGLNCSSGQYNVSDSQNVGYTNVNVSYYSPCTVSINNRSSVSGQVIGGTVSINNNFTMNFVPVLVPGVGEVVGFEQDIVYVREVRDE